jgi:hypothetical protein
MSETKTTTPAAKPARPTWKPAGRVHAAEQPFTYPLKREFVEPDWRRLPGYKDVSKEEWETALWQRRHTVKNLKELKDAFGDLIPDTLMASLERDIKERATMSILVPPHMLNTMDEKDLWNDPDVWPTRLYHHDPIAELANHRNPAATACTNRTCGRWRD